MTHYDRFRRTRGLALVAAAFAIGVVAGAAGVSSAAFAKKGWERFGYMFQQGYVAGFLDCVRIAKEFEPTSYIGQTYPLAKAKPTFWVAKITELYEDPKHEGRPLSQVMEIAGHDLAAKFGVVDGLTPEKMEALRRALNRTPEAADEAAKGEDSSTPKAEESSKPADDEE